MEPIELIKLTNYLLAVIFFTCYAYQLFYLAIPFIKKLPPHSKPRSHRYAALISARNEETVLPHLLKSIRAQDYPTDLITIFVVADNCTDHTAEVARDFGAIVCERYNAATKGKGYALSFLLEFIREQYGTNCFDSYFVFDADNLLAENYITEMNRTFSDGYRIITSYRNSKNFSDNWISAGYALWFLREAKYLNHARMALGVSCAVSGTGFLFSREALEKCGGWNFFLLTEDIEFTVHNVANGEKIGYCPTAVLYDEQPVTFRQSWRQRKRWARGYMQVYCKYFGKLFPGILHGSFSCFDMSMAIMPAIVISVFGLAVNLTASVAGMLSHEDVMIVVWSALQSVGNTYLFLLVLGMLTTISEWKQIHATAAKKLLYTLTFPLFMLTYIPISFSALFGKVEWKPIKHSVAISLEEMQLR